MTQEELKEILECDEIRDTWEYVQEFVEKFGKIPEDQDELVVCVNYVLECMQGNHQISVTDEWQVAEGLYKCTKRMFDGTPEGKILFEVGEVYKCLSKHAIAEFEVSYGHSVFLIDPVVRKHFIPLGEKDISEEKIKTMDYKKAYEAIFDRAKELWGIYKGERHIIEFIFPEVCYLKDKENRLKDMVNSRPKSINDNIPDKESEVICVNCSYRWISERPVTKPLKDIECPWCGKQGFVIETGEIIKSK